MRTAPSCPIHSGFLDSADYWTDDALMSAVMPLSADEINGMAAALYSNENRARIDRVA